MKKALAILLALALAGSLFAQDEPALGFTGLALEEVGITEDGISLWIYNEFSFYFSDGTWGLSATILINNGDYGFATTFRNYSIYVKLYDMLKITVGKVRMADYRVTPYVFNNLGELAGFTRVTGDQMVVQLTGVKDLSIGLGIPLSLAGTLWEDEINMIDLYASYNVAGIGKFFLNLKNIADAGRQIGFAASITAVENLFARLGFQYSEANMDIDLSLGYAMDAIDFGIDAKIDLPNGGDLAWAFEFLAGYMIDDAAYFKVMFYMDDSTDMVITPYFIQAFDYGEIDIYAPVIVSGGTTTWALNIDFILFY